MELAEAHAGRFRTERSRIIAARNRLDGSAEAWLALALVVKLTTEAVLARNELQPRNALLFPRAELLVLRLGAFDLLLALGVVQQRGLAVLLHHHRTAALQGGEVGFQRGAQLGAVVRGV